MVLDTPPVTPSEIQDILGIFVGCRLIYDVVLNTASLTPQTLKISNLDICIVIHIQYVVVLDPLLMTLSDTIITHVDILSSVLQES